MGSIPVNCPAIPMLARTSAGWRTTSYPTTLARPDVGRISVDKMLIVVVLPAPLWPSSPHTVPAGTEKSTPASASVLPRISL